MQKDCDYNHLVCQEHRELNKDHPFHQKLDIKVKDLHAKFPALKEANIAQEFTLLATSPEVPHMMQISLVSQTPQKEH